MSLVTVRTKTNVELVAFSDYIKPLTAISKESTLEQAIDVTQQLQFSATDCALPMLWAIHVCIFHICLHVM